MHAHYYGMRAGGKVPRRGSFAGPWRTFEFVVRVMWCFSSPKTENKTHALHKNNQNTHIPIQRVCPLHCNCGTRAYIPLDDVEHNCIIPRQANTSSTHIRSTCAHAAASRVCRRSHTRTLYVLHTYMFNSIAPGQRTETIWVINLAIGLCAAGSLMRAASAPASNPHVRWALFALYVPAGAVVSSAHT